MKVQLVQIAQAYLTLSKLMDVKCEIISEGMHTMNLLEKLEKETKSYMQMLLSIIKNYGNPDKKFNEEKIPLNPIEQRQYVTTEGMEKIKELNGQIIDFDIIPINLEAFSGANFTLGDLMVIKPFIKE